MTVACIQCMFKNSPHCTVGKFSHYGTPQKTPNPQCLVRTILYMFYHKRTHQEPVNQPFCGKISKLSELLICERDNLCLMVSNKYCQNTPSLGLFTSAWSRDFIHSLKQNRCLYLYCLDNALD